MANNINVDVTLIIRQIISHYGLKNFSEFARIIGISDDLMSKWRKRNSYDIDKIVESFPSLNRNWLLTGEGSMLKSEVDAGAIMVADNEEAYKKAIESGMSLIPEYSTPYHGGDGLVSEADHVVAYWGACLIYPLIAEACT